MPDLVAQTSADDLLALRRHGISLYGPPPSKLIPPISRSLLAETMLASLQEYRDRYEVSPRRSPKKMTNDALNACRSLYALRTGRIVSKSEGARWALRTFDRRWNEVIRAAVAFRRGEPTLNTEGVLRQALPGLTRFAWEEAQRLLSETQR